jgi:hypothetical protein
MLAIALRFVMIGTFVGGGAFVVAREFASSHASTTGIATVAHIVSIPFWGTLTWFLSLPFGFVPAVAAGLGYCYFIARHTTRNPSVAARCIYGAGFGLIASVTYGLLFSFGAGPGSYSVEVNEISWACAGILGGALSALSVRDRLYEIEFRSSDGRTA